MRRVSGAGASLTPSARATSMISGFGGPPLPRVTLTPLVSSTCSAEGTAGADVWRTLAVTSGAAVLCGAGKTSTFATANGSPLSDKSRPGSISRQTANARSAAPIADRLVARLRRTGSATGAPEAKPSGSSSSSHTSADAPRSERPRLANQPCPNLYSATAEARTPFIPEVGGASLPSHFHP